MTIHEAHLGGATIVAPVGRIDSTTSDTLDAHLVKVSASPGVSVVVDFERVEYISSAGLRVVLSLAKRLREKKGKLALCSLGDSVRQVFELAGFLPLFVIAPTRDGAVQALGSR